MTGKNIALITFHQHKDFFERVDINEDEQLISFLQGKELKVTSVAWNAPDIHWTQYDVVIIKSPWDYHDHIEAFYAWMKDIENLGIQILNPADTIRWNSNKKYLIEIAEAQLPIIPTLLLEKGTDPDWEQLFQNWDADKIVVKPCVSAGAKNTLLLSLDKIEEKSAELNALIESEDFLAQPYLKEIEQGEWSLLFFGGNFSHAILKTPKDGDFRVQHSHGGTFRLVEIEERYLQKAHLYVEKFAQNTLYVRVDGIIKNKEFYLMELELIEPYLYLDKATDSYENYYSALVKLLNLK